VLPKEPRRDEQLDAAESGRMSLCDPNAAGVVIVESAGGNIVVTAAGAASQGTTRVHSSAIQPEGAVRNLFPIAMGAAVHWSESTRSMTQNARQLQAPVLSISLCECAQTS
jgi:hypothetical protein